MSASEEVLAPSSDFVTVSVVRRVLPGQEKAYEQWVSGISHASAQFPGHLGVNILRPSGGDDHYTIIYRFDSQAHAEAWQQSDLRHEWTAKLAGIVEGETEIRSVTGLESWFDLPTIPIQQHPVRWRMCVVLITVVYLLITVLSIVLFPYLEGLDNHLRTLIVVSLQVILMTYVVMPRVTYYLKNWLYK